MSKAKVMPAAKRTTKPAKPKPAAELTAAETKMFDDDLNFGMLARSVGFYLADLDKFADGVFGPLPAAMAETVRGMAESTRAELANLAVMHARG